jgi:hypothetical protein
MSSKTFSAGFEFPEPTTGYTGDFKGLYVGTGGHVVLTFRGGAAGASGESGVKFYNVPNGTFMDVAFTHLGSTLSGTSATGLVGLH